MVNASLNWASIVGIVLAVCGAGLYFMRSFKPALARDYDVFFAAIGLLCGGILFFQGWRLDPILQFGQFLLAGTTVFFAYESVRLRGIAADQARRSSYFADEPLPSRMPTRGGRGDWEDSYEQFDDAPSYRRRFSPQDDLDNRQDSENDFYSPRRASRAAIPEEAASRRRRSRDLGESWDSEDRQQARRIDRFGANEQEMDQRPKFGERRNIRQDQRRGSRPSANPKNRETNDFNQGKSRQIYRGMRDQSSAGLRKDINAGVPRGKPMKQKPEDAAFMPSQKQNPRENRSNLDQSRASIQSKRRNQTSSDMPSSRKSSSASKPRDNSSRFDD